MCRRIGVEGPGAGDIDQSRINGDGRQIDVADYWCRIDAKFASELLALIEQLRP